MSSEISEKKELEEKLLRLQQEIAGLKNSLSLKKVRGDGAAAGETRGRLELVLDGGELGNWDWDIPSDMNRVNERWAGMLGYRIEEIEPRYEGWVQLIHPDDLMRVRETLAAHLEGRTAFYEVEHRLRHKSGNWVWVLTKGKVTARDASGRPLHMAGTHLDITERKRAEEALRKNVREFEGLMKYMANAFVVWETVFGKDGRLKDIVFSYFNDAYSRVSGLKLDDVRGRGVREVWPETEESWYEVYGGVALTGVPKTFEMYHKPTRGLYACNAYRPWDSKDRICVVFEDITRRREAEGALQKTNELLKAIIEAVPVAIIGLDLDGIVRTVWNPAAEKMLGWTAQEAMGKLLPTVPTDKREEFQKYREWMRKGLTMKGVEVRRQRRDGVLVDYSIYASPLHDSSGKIVGNIAVMVDITEHKRAEAALRTSEERFKRLVQNSSDVIAILDEKGIVASVSGPSKAIMGYEPEELVGTNAFDHIHPGDRESTLKTFTEDVAQAGSTHRWEYRFRHRDGSWVVMEAVGTNLLKDPVVKGIVLNIREITERKDAEEERNKLQEQLQQAMKMEAVGRLAGGVAHDFNNLLTVIHGYVELARMKLTPPDPLLKAIDGIHRAAESAAALTNQLLAFSRRQIIEPRVLSLNDLIEGLAKMLTRLIGEDIELRIVLAEVLGSVRVDPGQFEQVLVNLAVNARDAMPNGGRLVIETADVELDEEYCSRHSQMQPGRYIQLAMSDTGHGMSEEVKRHLFEPFFTTKDKGQGTGLGMATTFGAVKQAGGAIEVYSEVDRGTTFKIYLPRVEAQAERLVKEAPDLELARGKETILLVEDDEGVRDVALNILEHLGYRVLTAANGGEAFLLVEKHAGPIALLMTDVVMPGINGRELAERLLRLKPDMKVLFTSGYTENVIVHHGVVDRNLNFIGKPYSMQALARKIRDVLDQANRGERRGDHNG